MEKLTEELLIDIAKKSLINSDDLIEDAKLLEEKKRLPRCYTLNQLAIEEVGKSLVCIQLLEDDEYKTENGKKIFNEHFLHHKPKTFISSTIDYSIAKILLLRHPEGPRMITRNFEKFNTKEGLDLINNLKNQSLYTSIVNGKVINPTESINMHLISEVKFYAISRNAIAKHYFNNKVEDFFKFKESKVV